MRTCVERGVLTLLFMGATIGASGCGSLSDLIWREERVEPKYDIRDQSVLVVKFREDDGWYGESELADELYLRTMYSLQECDGVELITDAPLEAGIYDSLEETIPWQRLGQAAEADSLVLGTIHDISFREQNMIGMLIGRIQMTLEVFDVEAGRFALRKRLEVNYPKNPDAGHIEVDFEQYMPVLRGRLCQAAAEEISKILCGYVVDHASEGR